MIDLNQIFIFFAEKKFYAFLFSGNSMKKEFAELSRRVYGKGTRTNAGSFKSIRCY